LRSESEEHISPTLSISDTPRSPLINADPVIFYSVEYEENLLMEFLGSPSGNVHFDATPLSDDSVWASEFDPHLYQFPDLDEKPEPFVDNSFGTYWNASDDASPSTFSDYPMTTPKPEPVAEPESERRVLPSRAIPKRSVYSPTPYSRPASTMSSSSEARSSTSNVARRGRPKKNGSDTKMANYARNYREMKKAETRRFENRVEELEEENRQLKEENARFHEKFTNLEKDYDNIRRVLQHDSKLAPIMARVSAQSGSQSSTSSLPIGVCLHVGGSGMSVEVCDKCNSRSRSRPTKSISNTPLFGGDFDSISKFIA